VASSAKKAEPLSLLRRRRKELGLTLQEVADAVNSTKATIMKLEKGDMQLTESWMRRLAMPLACDPADLMAEEWPADVPVVGLICDGGILALYRPLPQAGLAEAADHWKGLEVVDRPPDGGHRGVVALRVQGGELEPFFRAGTLIYAADPIERDFKQYLNSIYNRYSLLRPMDATELHENVEIVWCSLVIYLKPM
jgi:transcriptional regulator with XRE-family HTH domain